ncbi:MAG: DNA-protecting protein DprA [Chloroflexi bacterium]|nr:DNA-protecting protein DprA [Chloroflexota bacterium]
MDDIKYWVGFSLVPGIGRVKFAALEEHFGSLESAWLASASELETAGLDSRSVKSVISRRAQVSLDAEVDKLARHHVDVLTWKDPVYPSRLKEIYDLPPVLYKRGTLTAEDEWAVAIVGTRRPTVYGRQVAEQLVTDLARNRITIVSGLARGIDAVAHRAALDAGGRTIAVTGCGLDVVYPSEHLRLAQEIIEHGCLISEYALGTLPKAENFPRRNRIMSGLCLGVLVVEAGDKSGALITARQALEQNREVFAVPGSVLSLASSGANRLIQDGAKLVMNVQDIMEELNLTTVARQLEMKEVVPANDLESELLKHLSPEPTHIDEVGRKASLPIATISSTLAIMELKGMVRQVGGMNYILLRESAAEYHIG